MRHYSVGEERMWRVLVTAASGMAIVAGLYLSAPSAHARPTSGAQSSPVSPVQAAPADPTETAAPAGNADFDPFKGLGLKEGDVMPPLKCAARDAFEKAVVSHGGSKLATATPMMDSFYRGFFYAQTFTPTGYPVGEHVVFAIKAVEGDEKTHGKPTMKAVIAFTLGDSLVCNAIPADGELINLMLRADGAADKRGQV